MSDWEWKLEPTYEGLIQAFQSMNCGIILEDWSGFIRYANRRLLETTGYEAEELDGEPVEILVPDELQDQLHSEQEKVKKGDVGTRLSALRRKDGRAIPVAVAPQPMVRLPNGRPVILSILFELGDVYAARPMGAPKGSLAAELAGVATKLQSLTFSASVSGQGVMPVDHPLLAELSDRETEILQLLMDNTRVPAIAERLFISQSTVRNHLKAIYRKVGVSSQSELIERVRSLGSTDEA